MTNEANFQRALEDLYLYLRTQEWDIDVIANHVEFASQWESPRVKEWIALTDEIEG